MVGAMAASILEVALNQALALALNQYPHQDEAGPQRLRAVDGKVVAIDLQGLETSFYLLFNGDSICVQSNLQGQADTRIAGTPLSFIRMGLEGKQQQQQGLFSGDVTITGDAELGRQVHALLDELDIDWEEHLSHLFGDVLAHQIGNQARAFGSWARQALETLTQDGSEYLREEARLLVSRHELEPFLAAVDVCRNDMARLEKRFERLQRHLQGLAQ
jgi:ubiquinone biosynthesis protein UbiJ